MRQVPEIRGRGGSGEGRERGMGSGERESLLMPMAQCSGVFRYDPPGLSLCLYCK